MSQRSLRIRHWKQHWNANAPMIYRKRLLVLGEQLEAGAPVTEEHIKTIGISRLKRWWDAGMLAHGEHPTKMAASEPELRVNSKALREGLESELRQPEPDAEHLRAELESEIASDDGMVISDRALTADETKTLSESPASEISVEVVNVAEPEAVADAVSDGVTDAITDALVANKDLVNQVLSPDDAPAEEAPQAEPEDAQPEG